MTLEPSDFATFYRDVHGYDPFPWQRTLLERVMTEGRGWPALLDLPTGSGKTSALDVALFALALDPTMPRRTLLVVDRRVIVSQAAQHAKVIAAKVAEATTPVTRAVRDALLRLQGGTGQTPVLVAELRGGTVRDDAWAKRPDAPLLGASTVDQVGSRLLFRGYGVGKKSASIHAGLIGNDTLLLLDEVHLSEPFRQTLTAISKHFRQPPASLPGRWQVVQMSATADAPPDEVHQLEEADWEAQELMQRLTASKPARLREVKVKSSDPTETLAEEAADEARALLGRGRRRVLVVMNRVDAARLVARSLASDGAIAVDLVTGRMRPWDRDRWLDGPATLLQFATSTDGPPRVVVSTQCIEAGADFDFDGLVTENASLDALRQRFGRLNRRGRYAVVEAVVLARSDLLKSPTADPLYGHAAEKTWRWLADHVGVDGTVDFGIRAMQKPLDDLKAGVAELVPEKKDAPVLLPGHLDLWARTSHRPAYEPELGPFLHGPEEGQPEVTLVWRGDVVDGQDEDQVVAGLTAVPPVGAEGLAVPLWAVRAWLERRGPVPVADVEAVVEAPTDEDGGDPLLAFRWSGGDGEDGWVAGVDLRPGDLLVIPASRGGLWLHNWDPTSEEPVADIGDEAQLRMRGWRVRRLHKGVCGFEVPPEVGPQADDYPDTVMDWLMEDPDRLPRAIFDGQRLSSRTYRVIDTGAHLVLRSRRRAKAGEEDGWSTGEGDRASYLGVKVSLDDHLGDVERWAGRLAANIGLAAELVADVALAGRLHDLGKADPRFQAMLQGGIALDSSLLAKSADGGADRSATRRAAKRAKYPPGSRHELLSVVLVEHDAELRSRANDWDLVLHLVASHHGWCRPFAPAVPDDEPMTVRAPFDGRVLEAVSAHDLASLASPIADRFHRLQRTYGWWGLAWLEAILRLADHRASEEREVSRG
ncbi:MAG: type I-U CRISPR-associated helicase/endonuclease Cas3 [Myxococcales bacterium]|nr:type I-U CRISPR-associated helicase/endonuclease Cas3 [Myxococcales bacterium]